MCGRSGVMRGLPSGVDVLSVCQREDIAKGRDRQQQISEGKKNCRVSGLLEQPIAADRPLLAGRLHRNVRCDMRRIDGMKQ